MRVFLDFPPHLASAPNRAISDLLAGLSFAALAGPPALPPAVALCFFHFFEPIFDWSFILYFYTQMVKLSNHSSPSFPLLISYQIGGTRLPH